MTASGPARFLGSLVPPLCFFALLFAIVMLVGSLLDGLTGFLLGILSGACIVLGLLLGYWNLVDWTNLRVIRRTKSSGPADWLDGAIVAVDGLVRVDGEPMSSPFSGTPCAAHTYVVSVRRHSHVRDRSRRLLIAQGYHLMPSHVDRAGQTLRLCALPGFADDLRRVEQGGTWGHEALRLIAMLTGSAPHAREDQILSGLLEARHTVVDEVHRDHLTGATTTHVDGITVIEEVLPVDRPVCVVGTYDRRLGGLTARRSRLGPNLIAYAGTADDVLARVGRELATFTRAAVVLIAIGAAIVAWALVRSG